MKASDLRTAMAAAWLYLVAGMILAIIGHSTLRYCGFVLTGCALGRFTMRGRIKVVPHD